VRDPASVFFSFLSVLIVLGLYIFFLADMQVDGIISSLNNIPGFPIDENAVEAMVNGWLIAGLLAVNTITIPLSILTMKVDDKIKKIGDDFNATPAKRWQLVMGYIISAWIIGIVTSLLILILGELYIVIKGGSILSFGAILAVLGIVSMSVILFSGIMYILVMFLTTATQVGTANTLVGTLSGFLGGIYVPLGVLGSVGTFIKIMPLAQVAALLRQIFMKDAIAEVFSGAPASVSADIRTFYGVDIVLGSHTMTSLELILLNLGLIVLFYAVAIILYSKLKRKN
jgi:multidrug/hemolysin transport system permease protein